MTSSTDSKSAWLKYGCGGCVAVIMLFILSSATLFLLARSKAQTGVLEDHDLRYDPPTEQLVTPTLEASPDTASPAAGTVILDLADAAFFIRPGKQGEPISVEARYDSSSYELVESSASAASAASNQPWRYEVRFRRIGFSLLAGLAEAFGAERPRIEVYLPPDVPLDLELRITQGGAEVDLAGLWLRSADIRFEKGGFELSILDPLVEPMERMTIHGSMGGFEVSRLGNASPRVLDIECSMGGADLDLRGEWLRDADIRIRTSMGGAALTLPRGVEIAGLAQRRQELSALEVSEIARPVLRFDVKSSMGELVITN